MDIDYYLGLPYTFKLFKEEDGSYFIKVKELPGCMSIGNTVLDAEEMLIEAMGSWIGNNLNRGFPIPLPENLTKKSIKDLVEKSFEDSTDNLIDNSIESLDYEKVSFLDNYEKDVSDLRSAFEKFLLSNDNHYFVKTRRGILIEIDGVLIIRDGEVIGSLDLYSDEVYEILKGILLK